MRKREIQGTFRLIRGITAITRNSPSEEISEKLDISLPARIEAVLYLKGKPLSILGISEILNTPPTQVEEALIALITSYSQRDTALEVNEKDGKYELQLQSGLSGLVQNLLPVDISGATLRTLATIALKKRILQSDLVELRGSGAYEHIKELLSLNFIEKKRQREGRSFWLTLSEKFHQTFAVIPDITATENDKVA